MDPLAAFRDGLVGQADDGEARQSCRQLDLDLDSAGLEPEISDGRNSGGQTSPWLGIILLARCTGLPQGFLRRPRFAPKCLAMISRDQWRGFIDHPVVEWSIFCVGVLLLLIAPLVGAIPGPGGVIVAGVGLAMVLKTSMWAKRRYVRFKKWQPKAGSWTDWALRRRSHFRRTRLEQLQKQREEQGRSHKSAEIQAPESLIPDPPEAPPETWADREGRARAGPRPD